MRLRSDRVCNCAIGKGRYGDPGAIQEARTTRLSLSTCDEQSARRHRDSARDSAREPFPAIETIQPRTEARDPGPPIATRSAVPAGRRPA
eukprot:8871400-Alexandrium_andersonii.AAC.1